MSIDVALARSLTPCCATVHHLNNAGASPSPRPVLDTVIGHLEREALVGAYEAADEAAAAREAVYDSVASLVGGAPDEVALCESATRAWDVVFHGMRFGPGDRILTGRSEYASNAIALLAVAGRTGASVEVIDDDPDGRIDLEALERALHEPVALVALTHVPTGGGLVNPAAEVGRLTRAHGVPFLLDACQSAGQLRLDVEELGCDALTATGRKFLRGPRGTGFAWVRRDFLATLDPPMPDVLSATWDEPFGFTLRDDARRLESWEASVACRLGLGAAIDHALALGVDAIEERVTALADELRGRLAEIDGVVVRDKGRRRCGIVTFTVADHDPSEVVARLRTNGVNTSVTSVTSAQFDLPARGLGDLVRASVHYFNDDSDLDALCREVRSIAVAS